MYCFSSDLAPDVMVISSPCSYLKWFICKGFVSFFWFPFPLIPFLSLASWNDVHWLPCVILLWPLWKFGICFQVIQITWILSVFFTIQYDIQFHSPTSEHSGVFCFIKYDDNNWCSGQAFPSPHDIWWGWMYRSLKYVGCYWGCDTESSAMRCLFLGVMVVWHLWSFAEMAKINPSGRQQKVLLFGGRQKRISYIFLSVDPNFKTPEHPSENWALEAKLFEGIGWGVFSSYKGQQGRNKSP